MAKPVIVDDLITPPSTVSPMLFVGLGGCGTKMVVRVKQHLMRRADYAERYKDLVRTIGVDTNINDLEKYRATLDESLLISDFEKQTYAQLATGELFLEPDDYFTQWVPPDYRFRAGDTAGAGQIRIESRLGMYYQVKHRDFLDKIRRQLEKLRSHEHGHKRLDTQEIRIVVCYSVAGGTGSGAHLPIAYLLRDLAKEIGKPFLIGCAVMPAVFEDKVGTNKDGIFANGYAALKETEYLMRLGAPESSYFPKDGHVFHYNPRETARRRVHDKPFEFLYLIDRPERFTVDNVVNAAADGLYLQFFTPIFGEQAGDYDNYTQHQRFLVPHDFEAKRMLGFTSFYGSFGSAVLMVPDDSLHEYCSQRAAVDVVGANFLASIPASKAYESIRMQSTEYDSVRFRDPERGESTYAVAELHELTPELRARVSEAMFVKRVRMLAVAERKAASNEQQFMEVVRHGHLLNESLPENNQYEKLSSTPEGDVKLLRSIFTKDPFKVSIVAAVARALGADRSDEGSEDDKLSRLITESPLFQAALAAAKRQFPRDSVSSREDDADAIKGEMEGKANAGRDVAIKRAFEVLEGGDKYDPDASFGFGFLNRLTFLTDHSASADVSLIAKRYAAIMLLRLPIVETALVTQSKGTALSTAGQDVTLKTTGFITKSVSDSDRAAAGNKLHQLAMKEVEVALQAKFQQLLGAFAQQLADYARFLGELEAAYQSTRKELEEQVSRLRSQPGRDSSAERYVLDGEAFQIENGTRLWEFYYQDQIVAKGLASANDQELSGHVAGWIGALLRSGRRNERTKKVVIRGMVDKLRTKVEARLAPVILGDPTHEDDSQRDGLTLDRALELEVRYRALYLSNLKEIEKDPYATIRNVVARFDALSEAAQREAYDPSLPLHRDYLRDKVRRLTDEKAQLLCLYDDSRDQHGGVRPDNVFVAAISERISTSPVGSAIQSIGNARLRWVTEGYTDNKQIVFYRAVLNVPLYVFGRMDTMKHYYYSFKNLAKRPKALHIDKNWETTLQDLDPQAAKDAYRQRLVRRQIVGFAALLAAADVTRGWGTGRLPGIVVRFEGDYWLRRPLTDIELAELEDRDNQAEQGVTTMYHVSNADVSDAARRNDYFDWLGDTIGDAVAALPSLLEADPVRYAMYQAYINNVRDGLSPALVKRIVEYPRIWRANRDTLRKQYGAKRTVEQERRLLDLEEGYERLADALYDTLEVLETRMSEQRLFAEAFDGGARGLDTDPTQNLDESLALLERFKEDWSRLQDPIGDVRVPDAFRALFQPLGSE